MLDKTHMHIHSTYVLVTCFADTSARVVTRFYAAIEIAVIIIIIPIIIVIITISIIVNILSSLPPIELLTPEIRAHFVYNFTYLFFLSSFAALLLVFLT